jgi:hypothetical protein
VVVACVFVMIDGLIQYGGVSHSVHASNSTDGSLCAVSGSGRRNLHSRECFSNGSGGGQLWRRRALERGSIDERRCSDGMNGLGCCVKIAYSSTHACFISIKCFAT